MRQPIAHPTGHPTVQPTSKPSRIIITIVAVKQLILGVTAATALTPAFQTAFIASIQKILPKGTVRRDS